MAEYPSTLQPPITVGGQKARVEAQLQANKQALGGSPIQALTIASGVVTPASGVTAFLRIDTEGGASSDDLTQIAVTNLPEGTVAIIQAANDARTVVVKNAAGGSGQLLLADGADFLLDTAKRGLILVRVGTSWEEVFRGYGGDSAALIASLGLGTAALANTGTSASDLPTNDQIFATVRSYTRQQYFAVATLTDASNIAWNLDAQQVAKVSLSATRTLANPTNQKDGGSYELRVVTNGNDLNFGSSYRWPGGTAPDLSGGAYWVLSFISDGTLMRGAAAGPYAAS